MGNTDNLHFTRKLFLGNTDAQYMDVLKILDPEDVHFVGKHVLAIYLILRNRGIW